MKLIKPLSVIAIMLFTFNYSFSQVIIGIGSTKKYLYNYFRLTTVSDNHRYDKLNLLNGGDVMHCEIKFDDNTNCDVIYVYKRDGDRYEYVINPVTDLCIAETHAYFNRKSTLKEELLQCGPDWVYNKDNTLYSKDGKYELLIYICEDNYTRYLFHELN